jgi:hypothetical protein
MEMVIVGEFSIPDLPKMTNRTAGKQWFSRHKERVKWQRLVDAQCVMLKITNLKLGSAVLTLTRHSSKAPDSDGLVSGFKPVIDSLVKCGVLVDDNYKIIGMPNFKWEYRTKKLGGMITVRIEKP